jgi:Holliday junction resolvase
MVDSRDKGARAESVVKDKLKELTGLKWERTPGSGALNEKHGLKGDLYIPNEKNYYVVEVKHYKDDHLTSAVLTGKNPQILEWWQQAIRQGKQVDKIPLLIFKFDRSKLFAAYEAMPTANYRYMFISIEGQEFYTALLDDYIKYEQPKFIA